MSDLATLYPSHVAEQRRIADAALARAGLDHLLIPSGRLRYPFQDDMPYPFAVNPLFKAWVPLTAHPDCWLIYTPGERPVLVYHQPYDYWHLAPSDPEGWWAAPFQIKVIREPEQALRHFPTAPERCAILGEPEWALGDYKPVQSSAVLHALHFARARKTPYELEAMRLASRIGVRAHGAAETAFREGASEYEIHLRYCAAANATEHELPYGNIIALNEHGAVLHYQHPARTRPSEARSFLIDAGASCHGYACDITRTHAAAPGAFKDLIDAVDGVQRRLVDGARPGRAFADLHGDAHLWLAQVLRDAGVIKIDAADAVERGVSNTFFPHGLGHLIGAQVHDVGGYQADPDGTPLERSKRFPYLRLLRTLEPDWVVTIEPGIYFIDLLLKRLREGPDKDTVDWNTIDTLRPYGGIRIEDDIRVTETVPENFTRDAFAECA